MSNPHTKHTKNIIIKYVLFPQFTSLSFLGSGLWTSTNTVNPALKHKYKYI